MKNKEETKEKYYYYAERSHGSFSHQLELPPIPMAPEVKATEIKIEGK
jgi:HSP20 family molecular chaperone IbpA